MRIVALLIGCVLLISTNGCGSLKKLEPLFEVNKTNIEELTANTERIAELLEQMASSVWDAEINSRIKSVALQLLDLANTYPNFETDFADLNSALYQEYDRFLKLLGAAQTDDVRASIVASNPVFAALAEQAVTVEQTSKDALRILDVAQQNPLARDQLWIVQADIGAHYPYVSEATENKQASVRSMQAYQSIVESQGALARAHAELFVFAAKSDIKVEEALIGVLTDEELEAEVLGLINNKESKDTAAGVLADLREVIGVAENAAEREQKE